MGTKFENQMDSQGSSRRSSACSMPDVDTCGLEEEQVSLILLLTWFKNSIIHELLMVIKHLLFMPFIGTL